MITFFIVGTTVLYYSVKSCIAMFKVARFGGKIVYKIIDKTNKLLK